MSITVVCIVLNVILQNGDLNMRTFEDPNKIVRFKITAPSNPYFDYINIRTRSHAERVAKAISTLPPFYESTMHAETVEGGGGHAGSYSKGKPCKAKGASSEPLIKHKQ